GGAILAGIAEDELPKVSRWAITRPKPGAEVRLWVEAGERQDPLLATWQYGRGRTAALPIDFQAGGAAWPTWRGFAKLWSQLTMWAAPHGLAAERRLEARRLREGTWLRLETVADGAGPFHLRVPEAGEVVLRPTGRRTFSALMPALAPGVHAAALVAGGHEEPGEVVVRARSARGRELRAAARVRGPGELLAQLGEPRVADVRRHADLETGAGAAAQGVRDDRLGRVGREPATAEEIAAGMVGSPDDAHPAEGRLAATLRTRLGHAALAVAKPDGTDQISIRADALQHPFGQVEEI